MQRTTRIAAIVAMLVLAGSMSAWAQGWGSCLEYADYMHVVGRLGASYYYGYSDIVTAGNFAYMQQDNAIGIVNISAPRSPRIVNSMYVWNPARGIAADSTRLLVVCNNSLVTSSLATPSNPIIQGSVPVSDGYCVDFGADIAAVGAGNGVSVVDISNLNSPQVVGSISGFPEVHGVLLDGQTIFAAAYYYGLQVIDVSNPAVPTVIASVPTGGSPYSIAKQGNLLAVGCVNCVQFFDVTDRTAPLLLGSVAIPGTVRDIKLRGTRAWLSSYGSSVVALDIANPHYPTITGRIATFGGCMGLDEDGGLIYVADGSAGLAVIDSANAESPPLLGAWSGASAAVRVEPQGSRAFVITADGRFGSLDCAEPSAPISGSWVETGSNQSTMIISEDLAYLNIPNVGVRIVDVSDLNAIEPIGMLAMQGTRECAIGGSMLYVAGVDALRVVDVSNPVSPILVAEMSVVTGTQIAAGGGYVVVGNQRTLAIVGVADPANPRLLGTVSSPENITDVKISGTQAVMAVGGSGVSLAEFASPSFPVIVSTTDTPGTATAVSVSGKKVAVADDSGGVTILDISNGARPEVIGNSLEQGNSVDVAMQADFVFSANRDGSVSLMRAPCPNLNMAVVSGSLGQLIDAGNLAGVAMGATAGYDPASESFSPPPAPGPYLDVSFYHPEWGVPLGDGFNSDLRPPYDLATESQVWPLRVTTNQAGTVTLHVTPNFGLGTGWGPWLRDLSTGAFIGLGRDREYSFEATGEAGFPDIHDFELVMGGSYGVPELAPVQRTLPAGWSIVGVPLLPTTGHQTWGDILLNDATGPAYLFGYANSGQYVARQGYDPVTPGEGAWVGAFNAFTWDMSGLPAVNGVSVPLRHGWNMVGYPLWVATGVGGIRVDHAGVRYGWEQAVELGLVAGALTDYDTDARTYVPVTNLATWHGYWLAAYQDDVSLWFDYRNATAPARARRPAASNTAPGGWALDIAVRNAAAAVTIGACFGATSGCDAAVDLPRPPDAPDAKVTDIVLLISHPDWDALVGSAYVADFIPPLATQYTWQLKLAARGATSADLTWDPAAIAAVGDLQLVVPSTGQVLVTSLREASTCTVPLVNGRQTIEVRLNAPASPVEGVPAATRLAANVPNPFNPSTTIRYELGVPARVLLRVYDTAGAHVRTLVDGVDETAGSHEVDWNGRDDTGRSVAGGLYFYCLEADGYRATRKMTLMK